MRPYKTFLILLVLMVLLYAPSFFLDGPLQLAPGISVEWPETYKEFYPDNNTTDSTFSAAAAVLSSTDTPVADTIDISREKNYFDFTGKTGRSWLIDSLSNDSGQVRIMYYGDSQLEGDRITNRLRERIREIIPGSGPGLLSPTPLVNYTRSVHIKNSGNWHKLDYLSYAEGDINHRQLGPMMTVSRFESADDEGKEAGAWFSAEPSRFADSLSSVYENIRIFYGKPDKKLVIEIIDDKGIVARDTLMPGSGEAEYIKELNSAAYVKVIFRGSTSPDIYGFSLESSKGAIVDNLPNRGSAGLEFTMVQPDNLKALYDKLDPDLIVLHYGLNVVLNISNDYDYYEDGLYRQLVRLKFVCPETPVLVIGITDMAHRDEGRIVSYKNIPLIRDAQKNAAERAGVLFWDSYEAMGGSGSIVKWSNKIPALAAKDFTHLTYSGGAALADLLMEDIVKDRNERVVDKQVKVADTLTESYSPGSDEGIKQIARGNIFSRIVDDALSYEQGKPLLFTGPAFWVLLLAGLIIYSLLFQKPVLRNTWLFLFSLFFYYKSGGIFFILLIVSTLCDYIAGLIIYASNRKGIRRLFVVLSLVVNLGMLSYFKYTGFFTGIINDVFNTSFPVIDWAAALSNFYLGTGFNVENIILPVGISFFTFQTISYTLDVYRGKTAPVRNILDFGFYVSFFPQLVAGPIVRASEFVPQLYAPFRLSKREWSHALFLIVSGLIKKIIISDLISINFVDRVFETPLLYSGLENLLAVYGYGLQIYCDFSGYTDIAIGVALMLGYRLPLNFNSPYKANNISNFWRRWHISLSRWLKDYLYISLGGNRKGRLRTNINLIITMLLGGLWHGAAWRFVIWGGLHGAGLVLHKIWSEIFPRKRSPGRFKRFISVLLTFNFVSFCWIFFRARDMEYAGMMIRQIFTSFNAGNLLDVFTAYSQVIIIIVCGYIIHFLPVRVKESYRGLFIKMPLLLKLILIYLLALVMYNVQSADIQPFIYFRF